MQIADKKIE